MTTLGGKRVGQQLGNYRLLRLLGQGGFAEVYLGEHMHLGTQAALKVLHTAIGKDDIEQFRTKARTIARLVHPHIVRILDFNVEGTVPFLVMNYAPDGTLSGHSRNVNAVAWSHDGTRIVSASSDSTVQVWQPK